MMDREMAHTLYAPYGGNPAKVYMSESSSLGPESMGHQSLDLLQEFYKNSSL